LLLPAGAGLRLACRHCLPEPRRGRGRYWRLRSVPHSNLR